MLLPLNKPTYTMMLHQSSKHYWNDKKCNENKRTSEIVISKIQQT